MKRAAKDIVAQAPAGEHVIGWRVDQIERAQLLARFPARYEEVVADHVTLKPHVASSAALPEETEGIIVGLADDGRGVQALVVSICGTTARPGGGTYHITWSLAPGREAQESNQVIAQCGWQSLDKPVMVRLVPARFP